MTIWQFRKAILLATLVLAAYSPVLAQRAGGLSFLKIGSDAVALSMAEANTARSQGAFATYWNPAGLAIGQSNGAALSHHVWVQDVRTYVGAARFRAGRNGGFGIAVTATSSGQIEVRDQPGDPDGLFDAQFVSAGVSYGHRFGPLSLGATVKYLTERIYVESASGYGFDAGVQLRLLRGDLQLGAAIQHLGSMDELAVQATPLPRTLRAGAAVRPFRILADLDGFPLLNTVFAAEISHRPYEGEGLLSEGDTQLRFGAEGEIAETILLRGGYMSNDPLRRFSLGLGFEWRPFAFDYAFLPVQEGFGGSAHILTLSYDW